MPKKDIKWEGVPYHRPFAAEGNNVNVMIDLILYARYHAYIAIILQFNNGTR